MVLSISLWEFLGIALIPTVTFLGYIIAYSQIREKNKLDKELEKYKLELSSQKTIDKMFIDKEFEQIQFLSFKSNNVCSKILSLFAKFEMKMNIDKGGESINEVESFSSQLKDFEKAMYLAYPFIPNITFAKLHKLMKDLYNQEKLLFDYINSRNVLFIDKTNEAFVTNLTRERFLIFDSYGFFRFKFDKNSELDKINPETMAYVSNIIKDTRNETK